MACGDDVSQHGGGVGGAQVSVVTFTQAATVRSQAVQVEPELFTQVHAWRDKVWEIKRDVLTIKTVSK